MVAGAIAHLMHRFGNGGEATTLRAHFGDIDIYLFDQLLRQRIVPGMSVFDAGCGAGRNLVYFLREGYAVAAVDGDPEAVRTVRALASVLAPGLPADGFRHESIEASSFPDGSADLVISSAVLHFARDDDHFERMLRGSWRIVAPGGLLFCRLASSIGIEHEISAVGGGRYALPDGTERYLVDEQRLTQWTARLGGRLADPIKTTVVQNQRAMTTWVVARVGT